MRYSDIKDDPKSYIMEVMSSDKVFRCYLLRCLNAIAGELDSVSYRMKAKRKVRRASRDKSKR